MSKPGTRNFAASRISTHAVWSRLPAYHHTYLLAVRPRFGEYADSAKIFCKLAEGKISEAYTYVMNSTLEDVALFRAVAEEAE